MTQLLPAILASLSLLGPFAVHLFFPLIPVLKTEFHLGTAEAQLAFTAGVLAMAVSTLWYGSLADRHGRRPVLLVGLAMFVAGSIISTFAGSFTILMIGRVIQSIGAGCGITLARAIAKDAYGPQLLVKSIAYLTTFFAIGGLVAPGIGGILIDQLGWRGVFGFSSVAGCAMLVGAYAVVPDTRAGTAPSQFGHSMASSFFELLSKPRFCALIAQTACSTGTFMVLATATAVLMKDTLHRPATEYGLYFCLVPAGFITGSVISGRISSRVSLERMLLVAASIAGAAAAIQSTLLLSGYVTPIVLFVPGTFMTLAQGLSLPFAQAGAMAIVPRLAGTAAGVGVFAQNVFGAGFAQIYGLLADGSPIPMIEITSVTVGCGFVAAVTALLTRPAGHVAARGTA